MSSLIISDEIDEKDSDAAVAFFLHPSVLVSEIEANRLILNLDKKEIIFKISSGKIQITKSEWYPQFGISIKSNVIQVSGFSGSLISSISWRDVI